MFQIIGYMDNFTTCGNTLHVVKRSKRLQVAQRLIKEAKGMAKTKMESIRAYIKEYIEDNNVKNEDEIVRYYNEAWEICKDSVSYGKNVWMEYMRG